MRLSLPPSEVRDLDSLIPYWRNPRRLSDEAVNAVAKSLDDYGYNQPIVIDGESVIIIGHTRYSALRRLGVKQAPVVTVSNLPAEKVKQLRILDNRAGEFTTWDLDSLLAELSAADSTLTYQWFPEVAPEDATLSPVAEAEWDESMAAVAADEQAQRQQTGTGTDVEFVCPSCLHMWSRAVTRDDVLSGRIEPHALDSQPA